MQLQNHIQEIINNPYFPITSVIIGLTGIILAVIFYFKNRSYKLPKYTVLDHVLIEGLEKLNKEYKGLEVLYNGEKQKNITNTKLAFWNAGSKTIKEEDIPSKSPLKIIIPEGVKILDVEVIHSSHEANNFQINPPKELDNGEKTIELSFEYFDSNEGGIVQLIHTGSKEETIKLEGKIIDSEPLEKFKHPLDNLDDNYLATIDIFLPFSNSVPYRKIFKLKIFAWFGVLVYSIGGLAAIYFPFFGNASYWILPLSALSFIAAYVMYASLAKIKIPSKISELI